jgi:serine protease Do
MRTLALLTPFVVLLFLSALAGGEERNRLADALAVQDALHQAIQRAEPAIACILVSRSDKYKAFAPGALESPGRLGKFDVKSVRRNMGLPETDPEYQALSHLDLSDPDTVPEAFGSGVVIDAREGLILTMAHVVRDATKLFVRLPGGAGSWADIHALDARSDLAVLRLIDRPSNLKELKLGDGGKLRKGDFLLSLSNPFAAGFPDGSPSASRGIVSNLRRRATGLLSDVLPYERNARLPLYCMGTLIQTDMRLNMGCSGGALLNLQGELVGLTSALAGIAGSETPGGFAFPLDAGFRRIIDVLRRGEEVEYGFLGVYLYKPDEIPEARSVRIKWLAPGGPAAMGGIHAPFFHGGFPRARDTAAHDYILSINGIPVHDNDDLFLTVCMQLAGHTVRVEVAGKPPQEARRFCSVTLAKFPAMAPIIASKRPLARGGLRVDWTSTRSPQLNTIAPGVVIREILPNSAAAKARLQPHMFVTKVNQQSVNNPAEFYREMEKAHGPVELTIAAPGEREEQFTLDPR